MKCQCGETINVNCPPGAVGPKGPQGVQGPAGAQGDVGPAGQDGAKGADGVVPVLASPPSDPSIQSWILNTAQDGSGALLQFRAPDGSVRSVPLT